MLFFEKQALLLMLFACLSGCASTLETTQADKQSTAQSTGKAKNAEQTVQSIEQKSDEEASQELPKHELDADLLSHILISSLASYNGDWTTAYENALMAARSSKDFRLAQIATSLALKQLRDYERALASALLWTSLQAESEPANSSLLLSQVGVGKVEEAMPGLSQYLQDSVDDGIKRVAGLLSQQTNVDAAFEVMQSFVQAYPDSAQVALSAFYVAEFFRDEKRAEDWLNRTLALDPDWDLAAQVKLNRLQRKKRIEEGATYLRDFVERNPKSVRMQLSYARDLATQEQFQSALAVVKKVLKLEPDNESALMFAGALLENEKQPKEAKSHYRKALKVSEDNDNARWSLARLAIDDEQYATAVRYYKDIRDPNMVFNAQLQAAKMQYKIEGLAAALLKLERIYPQTTQEYVQHSLARNSLLVEENKYQQAVSYINEVIVFIPDNPDLLYARGLAAAEIGELVMMENDLRFIIDQNPEHANALNALGYTLADQTKRLDEAQQLIAKALTLRPQDAHILDSMGWVLYRLKDYPKAIEYLQKAYQADKNAEIAAHLGEVLWEAGQQDEANRIWQLGVDSENDNRILDATLKRYGIR